MIYMLEAGAKLLIIVIMVIVLSIYYH